MSRNIKEIGKELMGKSLNSFHRKTGLTQLEKNNEMQDGILDGILSQVDDAYIEKTEQSNVMHLDGSGDGVVVLDSIEGNTMVNLIKTNMKNLEVTSIDAKNIDVVNLKPSTTYTFVAHLKDVCSTNVWLARVHFNRISDNSETYINVAPFQTYTSNTIVKYSFTTPNSDYAYKRTWVLWSSSLPSGEKMSFHNAMILEGDWTNKEVPVGLQGLQSSFEEKVNNEGKYEIEILSNNENLFNSTETGVKVPCFIKKGTKVVASHGTTNISNASIHYFDKDGNKIDWWTLNRVADNRRYRDFTILEDAYYFMFYNGEDGDLKDMAIKVGDGNYNYIPHKSNKIKLLLDEPLRAIDNLKDRLCIRDNKLVVERNTNQIVLDNNKTYGSYNSERPVRNGIISYDYQLPKEIRPKEGINKVVCDILPYNTRSVHNRDEVGIASYMNDSLNQNHIRFCLTKNTLGITEELQSKPYTTELLQFLRTNPISVVYRLNEPIYEEVLNEYGEPILLEGYENGTIYIDSTIVPTTTVKYTPKMESFKTLKEVNDNNIMLTNDVNDNIIPYMMDVDLMIMEKEMALPSKANIRRIGAKDMTSMQKRTQDMLERLIKGKTLTEKECKTRVVTYLNAGKITDEQADELMLLISEVYA